MKTKSLLHQCCKISTVSEAGAGKWRHHDHDKWHSDNEKLTSLQVGMLQRTTRTKRVRWAGTTWMLIHFDQLHLIEHVALMRPVSWWSYAQPDAQKGAYVWVTVSAVQPSKIPGSRPRPHHIACAEHQIDVLWCILVARKLPWNHDGFHAGCKGGLQLPHRTVYTDLIGFV